MYRCDHQDPLSRGEQTDLFIVLGLETRLCLPFPLVTLREAGGKAERE